MLLTILSYVAVAAVSATASWFVSAKVFERVTISKTVGSIMLDGNEVYAAFDSGSMIGIDTGDIVTLHVFRKK